MSESPRIMSGGPRDRIQDGTVTLGPKNTLELTEIRSALPAVVDTSKTGLIPQKPTLEGLATELKIHLLHHIFDIASLKALTHAVPLYHMAYVSQRCDILRSVLTNCLGSEVIIDALALAKALDIRRDLKNHALVDEVKRFMEKRKFCRSPGLLDLPDIPPEKLFLLIRLKATVETMTGLFVESRTKLDPTDLSQSEHRRIRRALYRFELFCVLFGRSSFGHPQKWSCERTCGSITAAEGMEFLAPFEPWEIEEIACVRDYAVELYQHLYQAPQQTFDLQASGGSGPSSLALYRFRTQYFAEACMSRGLSFMLKMIRLAAPERLSVLRKNQNEGYTFLTQCLEAPSYDYFHRTVRYNEWTNEISLRFISDNDGPNFAWTWANSNKVEIFYFKESAKHLREWAYVMWDKERVKKWRLAT